MYTRTSARAPPAPESPPASYQVRGAPDAPLAAPTPTQAPPLAIHTQDEPPSPPKPAVPIPVYPLHRVGYDGCYYDFGETDRDWWARCEDTRTPDEGPHRFEKRGMQYRKDYTRKRDGKLPWETDRHFD